MGCISPSFALAYLGGLRANTIVSLRVGHIDEREKTITQDGREARTKNGKSLTIFWFPIPDVFGETVTTWIMTMRQMGFRDDDTLYPKLDWFENRAEIKTPDRAPVAPMSTKQAVSDPFARAPTFGSLALTPHSARHTLAADRDRRSLTHEQRKAWSENFGHESERTTEIYYGKISSERRGEVLGEICESDTAAVAEMTTEEKVALVDTILAKLASAK